MSDPREQRLASVLVNYCLEIKKGQIAVIAGTPLAEPLLLAIYEEVLKAGGHPVTQIELPGSGEAKFRLGSDDQLDFLAPQMPLFIEKADAYVELLSSRNTREMSGVDPERQKRARLAMMPIMQTFQERAAAGELKWVGAQFPTNAHAQEADMSLRDYADFVYAACYCDQEDPVARWNELHDAQQRFVDWLKGKREVDVKGPNADLTLSIEGRTFDNEDGHVNMPGGEIFTSPVEESAEGWIRFTYPAIRSGREVDGIELHFKKGRVTEATAQKGQEFLISSLDTDPGARYLGEFAIGTNKGIQRFSKNLLFDEKIGGTIHLAVGRGFPETGGKNESAIHWDMICDMHNDSEIHVDGELFYKNGEFQI